MKLTSLTTSSSIGLSISIAVFAFLLHSKYEALDEKQEDFERVTHLEASLTESLIRPIETYLNTGDVSSIYQAQTIAQNLKDYLQSQDPQFRFNVDSSDLDLNQPLLLQSLSMLKDSESRRGAVLEELDGLLNLLKTDVRAAGKLGADEHALIIQNERETRYELESLFAYIASAKNSADSVLLNTYRSEGQKLLFKLQERTEYSQAGNTEGVNRTSEQMLAIVELLDQLPRLGVAIEEDEDDFSSLMGLETEDSTDSSDKGDDILSNLVSLLKRYEKEFQLTISNQKRADEVYRALRIQSSSLSELFSSFGKDVSQQTLDVARSHENKVIGLFVVITLIVVASNGFLSLLARRVTKVSESIREYSEGDLRISTDTPAISEELKTLRLSANSLRENVSGIVQGIRSRANIVVGASESVRSRMQAVSSNTEMQKAQSKEISDATEAMTEKFAEVTSNAIDAARQAKQMEIEFQRGSHSLHEAFRDVADLNQIVNQTASKISQLQNMVSQVDGVVAMIEEIANQTNLLALNAAIEAARAGQHGRGFAVVADEVRALAHKTTKSTLEIGAMTTEIRTQTEQCVEAMEEQVTAVTQSTDRGVAVIDELDKMMSAIKDIVEESEMISETTQAQLLVAKDITSNIRQIKSFTESIGAQQKVVSKESERLEQESKNLINSVAEFQLSDEYQEAPQELYEAVTEIDQQEDQNTDDILF